MWAGGFAFAILVYYWKVPLYGLALAALALAGFLYYNLIQNTAWLSGWLPLLVMCAVIAWFRSRRLFVLLSIAAVIMLLLNYDFIYAKVVQSNLDEGSGSRIDIWGVAVDHVLRHPLFGSGPAGYAAYYMTYNPLDARSTHNNYFDVLAQNGIVGLLLFLALIIRLAIMGLRNIAESNRQQDVFVRIFAVCTVAGIVGGLAAMMLGDWVLPFAYNQTITGFDNALFTWLFWGGIASLYWLNAESRQRKAEESAISTDEAALQ
jgi:O-antigen ligase